VTALASARLITSVNLCVTMQWRVDGYQVRGSAETDQKVKDGEAKKGEMRGVEARVRIVRSVCVSMSR
jgi:hypothetical protein